MTNATIAFTGGGSGGHVTPILAILEEIDLNEVRCIYIGTADGIEKKLIAPTNLPYYAISAGKLRRYFSWKTFIEPFKVLAGFFQSLNILRKERPKCLFSKGGFVAVPVVFAARMLNIPVIVHEADMTPGLANRLCFPLANKICLTYPGSEHAIRYPGKTQVTGLPLREFLFSGSKERALERCQFTDDKPILLVLGGSLGALKLNQMIRQYLDILLEKYNIIHLCGSGKVDSAYDNKSGYCQLEYANEELADFYHAAHIVISRAGSNTLYELLSLKIPHILIPLEQGSRGEQLANAHYSAGQNLSYIMVDSTLPDHFIDGLQNVEQLHGLYSQRLQKADFHNGKRQIATLIKAYC